MMGRGTFCEDRFFFFDIEKSYLLVFTLIHLKFLKIFK